MSEDSKTADAFAKSWNNLPLGSIYTDSQVSDWISPVKKNFLKNKSVLELGCGNASVMFHIVNYGVKKITGVDLGDSLIAASRNMILTKSKNWQLIKADLLTFKSKGYDFVYSIGVLHHLKNPKDGFNAVVSNVKNGGAFHCWVYAHEGNALIRYLVDPIRFFSAKLPWQINKYLIATPLALPFYCYCLLLKFLSKKNYLWLKGFPLYYYALWISERDFLFFRHVAFDQLVTPQTKYIKKNEIESWIKDNKKINQKTTYIIFRNGNSWKFGGRIY